MDGGNCGPCQQGVETGHSRGKTPQTQGYYACGNISPYRKAFVPGAFGKKERILSLH